MDSATLGYPNVNYKSPATSRTEIMPSASAPSRPLRVFVLLEGTSTSGAVKPVTQFVREAGRHAESNLEVIVGTFIRGSVANDLEETFRQLGVTVELIRERGPWDWRIIPQLLCMVTSWHPDIVWTHGSKSHFLVRLLCLHHRAKWIATHHGYTTESWRVRLYNHLDRWSLRGAHRVVTVCRAFADELARRGVPRARLYVQHTPIRLRRYRSDPSLQTLRTQLGISADSRIVLTVGRLSSEKGHADLLKALAKRRELGRLLPPIAVIVVGDGPERSRLTALCSEMELHDTVHFVGFHEDVRSYYSVADLFVLPSHSEGSPNVILEAIDAGVPILATDVGGVSEIVKDEVSALLVPAKQPLALANGINRLLADESLRKRLIEQGRGVLELHTPEEYFRHISTVFIECCEVA
jgi:glycosyltransferase involved in cell wall biosynthesis